MLFTASLPHKDTFGPSLPTDQGSPLCCHWTQLVMLQVGGAAIVTDIIMTRVVPVTPESDQSALVISKLVMSS